MRQDVRMLLNFRRAICTLWVNKNEKIYWYPKFRKMLIDIQIILLPKDSTLN